MAKLKLLALNLPDSTISLATCTVFRVATGSGDGTATSQPQVQARPRRKWELPASSDVPVGAEANGRAGGGAREGPPREKEEDGSLAPLTAVMDALVIQAISRQYRAVSQACVR